MLELVLVLLVTWAGVGELCAGELWCVVVLVLVQVLVLLVACACGGAAPGCLCWAV